MTNEFFSFFHCFTFHYYLNNIKWCIVSLEISRKSERELILELCAVKTHHISNTKDSTIWMVINGLETSLCVCTCVCLMWSQWQHPVLKKELSEALSVLLIHSHGRCLYTMATTSVEECSSMNSGCSLLPSAGTSKYNTNVKYHYHWIISETKQHLTIFVFTSK